jgi:hypothetical protein
VPFDPAAHLGGVPLEADGSDGGQQAAQPVEVILGRGMADADPGRDGPERERIEALLFQLQQPASISAVLQIAVVIIFSCFLSA